MEGLATRYASAKAIVLVVGLLLPALPGAVADEAAPQLVKVPLSNYPLGLDADEGGAWVSVDDGILRVGLDDAQTRVLSVDASHAVRALDGDAFVVQAPYLGGVRKMTAAGDEPVIRWASDFDLGADGALYAATPGGVVRLEPGTRDATMLIADHSVQQVAVAPDGELHILSNSGVRRLDAETQSFVPVYVGGTENQTWTPFGLAFDAAGRLYVLERLYGGPNTSSANSPRLVRVDDGAATVLFQFPASMWVKGLAFGGTRLYTLYATPSSDKGLAYLDLGVPGFRGFTGSLPLPPAGDLAVTEVRVERPTWPAEPDPLRRNDLLETRMVVVTVQNVGEGAVEEPWGAHLSFRPISVTAIATTVASVGAPRHWELAHDGPLAPGESVTFRIPWDTKTYAGDFEFLAQADVLNFVPEGVEFENNRATTRTIVRTTF